MPVSFLTSAQQESYGRYAAPPSPDELARFFHLSEDDQALTLSRRGDHNRLGFALQLTTVRFLGTFLENSMTVPSEIVQTLSRQLGITKSEAIGEYRQGRWRRQHAAEIRERFGYRDFSDPAAGFRLARWLCALCWTGTERPSVLFDRAMAWLLTHKVLLPGLSVLERFIARLRGRMENRLWRSLGRGTTAEQRARLEGLLTVPEGSRASGLERLRLSPISVSGPALVRALERLQDVRGLEIRLPATVHVAPTRLASLARFASAAKVTSIIRLAPARRLARAVFHGKRGELRQRYREGQEDQLGALGLVLNVIVLWNTIYIEAALEQLRQGAQPVHEEDVARLSPLIYDHINLLGRYSFAIPEAVIRGELRPLHNPADDA
jgi:hypothetical protein